MKNLLLACFCVMTVAAFAAEKRGNCIRLWAGHKSLEVMPDEPGVFDRNQGSRQCRRRNGPSPLISEVPQLLPSAAEVLYNDGMNMLWTCHRRVLVEYIPDVNLRKEFNK